jgi:EAL domain-containing protein (putative c-di-GMP-specific phosphodiesterase class I)
MNDGMLEQIRLTGGLASAVRQGEFVLHYQPQLNLASGRIVGVEALVRWQHPTDGLLPPGKFIDLAERSGHIVPLGEWVLHEACRQARSWQDQQIDTPVVGVNLSALQFKRGNVLELVASALAASGLSPACLELELTESILLQDVEATIKTLQGLKAMGVKLSIDDFGTGYSSLSYLKRLAVDKLKIDQSFVRDMLTGTDGASIVRAIIQLGHNLQLTVIAEGVETTAERDFLEKSGCDEAQGYLFSRPVPVDQIEPLLRRGIGRPGGAIEPAHDL